MARPDIRPEDLGRGDLPSAGERMKFPWWLVLVQGIAGVVIGLLLVTQPSLTILTLVVFLGVYWLIGGVVDLVSIFVDHTNWGWRLFTAVLGILAGLVIVRNPLWAGIAVPSTLVWFLGIIGVIVGGVRIIRALTGAGWGEGILGALSIVLGIILLARPLFSLGILAYLAGFWAIVGGVAAIVGAFWLRGNPRPMVGPAG